MSFDARTRILIGQANVVSQQPTDIHRENTNKKCEVHGTEGVEYDVWVIEHGTSFLLVCHVLSLSWRTRAHNERLTHSRHPQLFGECGPDVHVSRFSSH